MRLKLTSDLDVVQKKISEYSSDDEISNLEVINLTNLADEQLDAINVDIFNDSKKSLQKAVDDVCQALQKMAIATEKNKPSQEDCDKLNMAVQLQLTQIILNYNRTIGKVKFKTGFLEYFKKVPPKTL